LAVRTTSIDSCQWFRTYSSRNSEVECSVIEALSASMALMTIFSPVLVGPEYAAEEFSGGGLGFNNPTRELLKEAHSVYGGECQLSLILSIGAGRPKELSMENTLRNSNALEDMLSKLVVNCETVERDIAYQSYDVGAYVRLSVDQGLEDIGFYDWSHLGKVTSHTKQYLQGTPVAKLVDSAIISLTECQGGVLLSQLSESFIFTCA
jgi:hypothetical protein